MLARKRQLTNGRFREVLIVARAAGMVKVSGRRPTPGPANGDGRHPKTFTISVTFRRLLKADTADAKRRR
jgi:hypothetical protein